MKIGILIDELVSGGFQKVAIMEAKYLNELGHEAFLVVLHRIENEGYQDLIEKNNIEVIRLSDRLPSLLNINFRFPFFAFFSFFHVFYPFFIWRNIRKGEFDFFITHGTYTAFSSISIKRALGIPFISFIHDSVTYILENKYKNKVGSGIFSFLVFIAKRLDHWIIKKSDAVIAFPDMIEEMKKVFSNYAHYQNTYNGCETIAKDEIKFNKSDFAISITKWDQGKNFHLLLDIWDKLDIKIPLKVIGSFHPNSLEDETRQLINQRGLSNFIEIIGSVTEDELRKYYQTAKFLVHPCREAFGMTILEASANGCPAIFTNNSGVAELYPKTIREALPSEKNLEQYIGSISHLVNLNEDEYRALIKEYHDTAIKNSWTRHCEGIVKLLH